MTADTTQPDAAVIERAAEAMAKDDGHPEWEALFQHEVEVYLSRARAAAGVFVPATAEQIAVAIEKMPDQEYTLAELKAEGFGDDLGVIYRDARGNAARVARSFAAGLSTGAKGGDGDE